MGKGRGEGEEEEGRGRKGGGHHYMHRCELLAVCVVLLLSVSLVKLHNMLSELRLCWRRTRTSFSKCMLASFSGTWMEGEEGNGREEGRGRGRRGEGRRGEGGGKEGCCLTAVATSCVELSILHLLYV